MMTGRKTARERYDELAVCRDRYLAEFRLCSKLTIPHVMPPDGWEPGAPLKKPAQSNGAQGVNSLAAKYLLGLLPTNMPMFRLEYSNIAESIGAAAQGEQAKGMLAKSAEEMKSNIAKVPREALLLTESFQHRPRIFEAMKHLIIGGNVLLWLMMDGTIRAIPLSRYVVLRNSLGQPIEIIVKDSLNAANMPAKLTALLSSKQTEQQILTDAAEVKHQSPQEQHPLFTYACYDVLRKKWVVHQEFNDVKVEGTDALYKPDDFPLVPLCFARADCEDYGTGLVSDYRGILMSIEALAQSETTCAISMSETRWAINPAAGIRARDFMNTPPNQAIDADPDMIKAITADKYGDIAAVAATKAALQKEWGIAFLLQTAITRDAERVTAEEIKSMIQMLDTTHGGQYTALAGEMQSPMTRYQLRLVKKFSGIDINKHRSNHIRPIIITGAAALGQNADAAVKLSYFRMMKEIVGEAELGRRVNVDVVGSAVGRDFNLETDGFFRSQEELDAEAAAMAQDRQNEKVAPVVAGAAGKMLANAQQGEAA